jgi:hypothetical protein
VIESVPDEGRMVHQRTIKPADLVKGRGQTLGYNIDDGNLRIKRLQSLRQGQSHASVTTAHIRGENQNPVIRVFHIDTFIK